MTAVLQPELSNLFEVTLDPPSHRLNGPFSLYEYEHNLNSADISSIKQEYVCCPPSGASVRSFISDSQIRNDENLAPLPLLRIDTRRFRSVSVHNSGSPARIPTTKPLKSRNFTFQSKTTSSGFMKGDSNAKSRPDADINQDNTGLLSATAVTAPSGPVPENDSKVDSLPGQHHLQPQAKETSVQNLELLQPCNKVIAIPDSMFPGVRELRQRSMSKDSVPADRSPITSQRLVHQEQSSDGSSAFVRSMKTASMTNASFSILQKSIRMGKSTDSCIIFESQPRYSMESDRPLSSCSYDDIAVKRGFKRQHIIDELISTEESYIVDLKALVYLYSTLLASTSSIPNRVRSAIEKNVDEILRTHERLVDEFHSARLQAAARRWADTAVPTKLGHHRHAHSSHSERQSRFVSSEVSYQTNSNEPAGLLAHQMQRNRCAEPIDVHEITNIFKVAARHFSAYEVYCANFEAIEHELQKHMPQIWSVYEFGMESLARAIVAIDQRQAQDRRGLTVGDLLIKPIQRLTKYPLLLEQLLHNTPVADDPGTHAELDLVLQSLRHVVYMVNLARDNQFTRVQIQRKSLLHDRLDLFGINVTPDQFRSLGQIELCGVLHVVYQSTVAIQGGYALCVLFGEHFLVAFPRGNSGSFEAVALIQLSDIKIESSTDGKGLQCASAFFTWKISFACRGSYHELILSGCSKVEEDHWKSGLDGDFGDSNHPWPNSNSPIQTCVALGLKSTGVVFISSKSLSRDSTVQRAATVAGRPSISQVIIRNTYQSQNLHDYRESTSNLLVNRSQSHMSAKRVPILEPKRSERIRIENSIGDIWTRERLPFPGMVGSRGGQMLRASAGSLARKLSLASIHYPFSKGRTPSLSIASRKSYDMFNDVKSNLEHRKREQDYLQSSQTKPKEIPEVDDMRSVVGRMIGNSERLHDRDQETRKHTIERSWNKKTRKTSSREVESSDLASTYHQQPSQAPAMTKQYGIAPGSKTETVSLKNTEGPRRRKKRWSKPISKLKEFGSEARSMLYSGSSVA